uniref:Uncharacterized protein n=1 Tax=Panagrolaimus sp. JU765 TaxID=591449 RepID=A0AC34R8T8_9BILA
MSFQLRNFLLLKPVFVCIYLFGIIVCVPLSSAVWFVRRNLFHERSVAGDTQSCSSSLSIQNNGTADQTGVQLA